MEEMLEDTLQMEDDEELEEEADAEVDKVLYDLTEGKLGQAGTVKDELPVRDLVWRARWCVDSGLCSRCRTRWRTKRRRGRWSSTGSS